YPDPPYQQQQHQQPQVPEPRRQAPQQIQQLSQEEIEKKALIDSPTETYNLRSMVRMLQHEVNRSIQFNRPLSVMVVGLSQLKTVEGLNGLVAFTLALSAAATRIKAHCGVADLVGRYSEYRFMVICPERTAEDAMKLAEHIRMGFEQSFANSQVSIPAAVGVASMSDGCEDVESLIAIADLGADMALERGDNRICRAAAEA
ncbi:MAG: GGDEF domain-containing protein, partial [Terriglobales bacterium]